ncbi:MAG: hypothetical protein NDJ89_10445 [Oligoflexia bacterium]|nr:hypothetical protein [Oligoflexia bacterium]
MRNFTAPVVILLYLCSVLSPMSAQGAPASDGSRFEAEVNEFLRRWSQDPARMMNEAPSHWNAEGERIPPEDPRELRFPPEAIKSGAALAARDRIRARSCMVWLGKTKCLDDRVGIRAGISGSDLPEALVDNGTRLVRTLEELERRGLQSAWLSANPWSGDYWPTFKGRLGARYGDAGFPGYDWTSAYNYVQQLPASWVYRNASSASVDLLAPSEKYDLLVGDPDFTLTQGEWQEGAQKYANDGLIETWAGLCDGWAAAAMMVPRPASAIRVSAGDGDRSLVFYPTDLKALASALWANGKFERRFAGGRCEVTQPRTDGYGRIISEECFDTNPATWHLAVTNQLGISGRSLILDSTYDFQVWNQPVVGYTYRYFNPQSMYLVSSIEQARVPLSRLADRFSSYRSPEAVAVVGIAMDVSYMIGTAPVQANRDSEAYDYLRTVRYLYDLELNRTGEVIGGEWYQNAHPDFLWVPAPGERASSYHEDLAIGSWDPSRPMPSSWQSAARGASGSGLPLAKVLEALLRLSR